MKRSFIQRLKDISITKKLFVTIGAMAILIVLELITLWFAIHTLSSVRAFVGAEGLWSKAQKDAVFQLGKYYRTHNEGDYANFRKAMLVPLGDHKTRIELLKTHPNLDTARAGFLQGRIHPDDIDGMIRLFTRFHNIYYINKAIGLWAEGDSIIAQLIPLGEKLHQEINMESPSAERLHALMDQVAPINERLTVLEDEFSFTLGEGSRWLENLILKLLFAVALTVEITGLIITISVTRSITKGLNEITRATTKIAKGDLDERAQVYSLDEIGKVAMAMNKMTEQLVQSNKELGQFAYIASHDLQEPLRSISNYVGLFQKEFKGKMNEEADQYLAAIARSTSRMQLLIKDMLDYSRLGHDNKPCSTDCNKMLQEVQQEMSALIESTHTKLFIEELPIINCYPELKLVFQNLISNAIKFRKPDSEAIIHVSVETNSDECTFKVKDNGIGIESQYYDRIFVIFQRLHTQKEFPGSGIGLAHCKKIIEMHGGQIWVESEYGRGSTFYFTVPQINVK